MARGARTSSQALVQLLLLILRGGITPIRLPGNKMLRRYPARKHEIRRVTAV